MIFSDMNKKNYVYLVKPALLVMLRVETLAWQWSLRLEDDIRVRDSVSNPGFLDRRNKIDRIRNLYTLNDYGDPNTVVFISGFLFRADVGRKREVNKMSSKVSDRWEFIGSRLKLNFHTGGTGAGGDLGIARVLDSVLGHDDGEGILLPWVANKDFGNGLDGVDDHRRLLFSRKDTRAMIFIHDGGQNQFFLGELETDEFKLKRGIRARRKKDLVHLKILWVLELIEKNFLLLADCLHIGGGVGEDVKWRRVMIRTETKKRFNKALRGLGKYEVPCEDGGSWMATHSLDRDDMFGQKSEVEHLEDKVTENAVGGLTGGLVTMGKSFALDLETSTDVFTIDTVNSLLYKVLQGLVVQGELLLAFLELLLPSLQGSQSNFGRIGHSGDGFGSWSVTKMDGTDRAKIMLWCLGG